MSSVYTFFRLGKYHCFGLVQALCGKMLWNGSVLWSMWKPCRRCGSRRVSAAVKRPRRCKRSAAVLSLLLMLPLLGMAAVAPCAAAVLLAPLFLATVLRCWQLSITCCPWQAWFCRQCLSGDIFSLSDGCFIQKIFFLCPAVSGYVVASGEVFGYLASALETGGWFQSLAIKCVHICCLL